MEHLSFEVWGKRIEVDKKGTVLQGEIVQEVRSFSVHRDDYYIFRKNEKNYTTFKEAYKALIQKAKQYEGTTYVMTMDFENKLQFGNVYTLNMLHATKRKKEPIIRLTFSYEKAPFATINTEKSTLENDYHLNEDNLFLLDWLPKSIKRNQTLLQQKIKEFEVFNIKKIEFKSLQEDELRDHFFNELRHCVKGIGEVFPLMDFYPIERIYFSPYKKYRGIYKPSQIAFHPNSISSIRSTIYHEYGHHFYEGGMYNLGEHRYFANEYREKASIIMEELILLLSKEQTLSVIWKEAKWRMECFPSSKKTHLHQYLTEYEEYLVRPTEMFARLFESYMLHKDHQKNNSLSYELRFTKEELERAEPLFLSYLSVIKEGYEHITSVR